MIDELNFNKIIQNGISITSSGTTGNPKSYFQPPAKIIAANKVAVQVQSISKSSSVYTCCKTTHAGGLLAQTIPAMSVGASVTIEPFNAYRFVKIIHQYTHTHITPLHAKAIMSTKGFKDIDFNGMIITCGADPVTWDIVESFVSRNARFITNWGMSEVGPIAINSIFDSIDYVFDKKEKCPPDATLLGDTYYCSFRINNSQLEVKGEICIYDDWFSTNDKVEIIDGTLYYKGRINKDIDLWNPKKG